VSGEYDRKRDFSRTPEPSGTGQGSPRSERDAPSRRFVIQEHSATRLHWDLRLEHDGALASWALPNGLPWAPKDNRLAVHTEDHPLEYLEFHGEIPAGNYGAGTMTIWDTGTFEVLKWEPRKIEVALHGERATGRYALFPLDRDDPPGKDWMVHRMDPPQDPGREPLPAAFEPMLARAGDLPPRPEEWAFEIKWDGVRALAFSAPGRLRLAARSGTDITARYPELARMNRALSMHEAVLDGEVVAFDDDGRPDFGLLQSRIHLTGDARVRRAAADRPVTYIAFDLVWLDGHAWTAEPYEARRAALRELLADGPRWQVPDHVVGAGAGLLAASRERGLEGIVAKRLGSAYEPGRRSPCWVKVKNKHRQELVVGGWVPGDGRRRDRIGALLVGVREDGALRYAGRVGTGFTEAELDRLRELLLPLEQDACPFAAGAVRARGAGIPRTAVFARPELVAEVEFVEWTKDGILRAPSYKGLRDDKPPVEVVREVGGREPHQVLRVDGREVRLTKPGKAIFPSGFTKREYVDYLVAIAPTLLPHVRDRQLTLKRYPDGASGEPFYEKAAPVHRPDWVTVDAENFVVADSAATLAWLGQLLDLELHTPMARVGAMERATMVAFDLDPGAPAGLLECCDVALLLEGMFGGLGLRAFPKTSGSKGMQVYVPLNGAGASHEATKAFAKAVAELLEAELPQLVVSRQAKVRRTGKVLVDWSQNDRHKTTVTVYSVRARDRPTVSTPLTWDEVRAAAQERDAGGLVFETADVLARVGEQGDLFAETLSLVQVLPGG
jgi:bifunctional non-homologous end joining protein LigD